MMDVKSDEATGNIQFQKSRRVAVLVKTSIEARAVFWFCYNN